MTGSGDSPDISRVLSENTWAIAQRVVSDKMPRPDTIDWLRCVRCHGTLNPFLGRVYCPACGDSWPVFAGLADFTESGKRAEERTFESFTRALPELVSVAASCGWCKALQKVIQPLPGIGPGLFRYVTDESKGDLVSLMGIGRGQKVLDLGCGLGPVSVSIAQQGAHCHAIDISWYCAAFTTIRCHQQGFTNVRAACAGDDMKLPLADGYFDAIVMNGVIEWLGCAERFSGSPEQAQIAMLREAHRVLKKGGQLYVATKNRYALVYVLGATPNHGTQLPWIGILPVRLQRWLTAGRIPDSRARLCGLRGYRRLFREAGFTEHIVYAVLPEFRHPERFIPLTVPSPVGFKGPGSNRIYNRRLERIVASLLPSTLLKHLTFCYGFLLEKT